MKCPFYCDNKKPFIILLVLNIAISSKHKWKYYFLLFRIACFNKNNKICIKSPFAPRNEKRQLYHHITLNSCQNYVVELTDLQNHYNMSKLIKTYNACALLSKYNRFLTIALANDLINKKFNLIFNSYRQRWRRHSGFYNIRFLPIIIPFGITTALCQQYTKHTEKRFFRAVQYGVDEEVRRFKSPVFFLGFE